MKIEQPPLTTCCSTCNAGKHWKKRKKNNFPCIFRYVTPGICLISMDELPLTFSLPKTDSLKQISFHSFSWGQGVISLHFLSTPWICCALYSAAKIIWIDWPLTFCSCSLWCKFWLHEMAKGIIFKVFTPASSIYMEPGWGAGWLRGHSEPHDHLKDDILSRPSSVVSMGECRQRSGQLSPVSICAARCLDCHTNLLSPSPSSPHYFLYISVFLSHAYMLTYTV